MLKIILKGLVARKRRFLLTFLSVVLGVSFVSGSYVFTDSITSTFDSLFSDVYAGNDLTVRSVEEETFDEHVIGHVEGVDGIESFDPDVDGDVLLLDKEGEPIILGGPPSIGFSWTPVEALNPTTIKEGNGRAPEAYGEVVIDVNTSKTYGFNIGDKVKIQAANDLEEFTIVGLLNFGSLDSFAGAILVAFSFEQAQDMFDLQGELTEIVIKIEEGADIEKVKADIEASVVGDGVEVVTGDQQTQEELDDISSDLGFIQIFFLAFAGIAIFVATFIIQNTFRIVIAQRAKELALLRSIGASRLQIVGMVVAEALLVGLVASVVGLFAGVGLAELIKILMEQVGIDLPSGGAEIQGRTVVISIVVGLIVTVISALLPALRASRISPMQAMSQHENTAGSKSLVVRSVIGAIVVAIGLLGLWLGLTDRGGDNPLYIVAAGVAAMFIGVSILAPYIVKPFASIVGWPFRKLYKVPADLAIGNSKRSPRRTASTAAALMIGVALISLISILGASVKSTIDEVLTESFPADFTIVSQANFSGPNDFNGGINREFTQSAKALDELDTVSVLRYNSADFDVSNDNPDDSAGLSSLIIGVDPMTLDEVVKLKPTGSSYEDLKDLNTVFVRDEELQNRGLSIGDSFMIGLGDESVELSIVGSFEEPFDSSYLIGLGTYDQYFDDTQDTTLFTRVNQQYTDEQARAALNEIAEPHPILQISDKTELIEQAEEQIDQLLVLIWALLLLAVEISVIGITNTLTLSISERQREIGMLRAIGMTRKQIKRMIRIESIIIAVFGAVLGVLMGIFFGWALIQALESEGFTGFAVPVGQLILIVVLAALAGVIASLLPSRRAAKTDLLEAISTE